MSETGISLWSGRRDLNSRHPAWKAEALPTELLPPLSAPNAPRNCSQQPAKKINMWILLYKKTKKTSAGSHVVF